MDASAAAIVGDPGDQPGSGTEAESPAWRRELAVALLCGAAGIAAAIAHQLGAPPAAVLALWAVCYAAGAWDAARELVPKLLRGILDIDFLMLVVALGAAALGYYAEGAILLFLFSFSGSLESFAEARTESAITALLKDAPKEAVVLDPDGRERRAPADSLAAGNVVRLRPGERVPADCRVLHGATSVDESMLTGESTPATRSLGSELSAGSLLVDGGVDAEVLRPASESTLQRMVQLVLRARAEKAPSESFTDRFGTPYTYAILGASALYGGGLWLWGIPGAEALYRMMTLLVVASPCALVLSIPSAILTAIAAGARRGILFRHGGAVENLAGIRHFIFDKTGTLTTGELHLREVVLGGAWTRDEALRAAAEAELRSEHPVARSIVRAAREEGIDPAPPAKFLAYPGEGVEAETSLGTVAVGRPSFVRERLGGVFPATWELAEDAAGVVRVFSGRGRQSAEFVLEDQLRPDAAALLARLRTLRVRRTLLSGDRPGPVAQVARELEMDAHIAKARPEEKLEFVKTSRAEGPTAMVGDGVNDAAALAAADLAIVMGGRGSDAALAQGDVILVGDRLAKLGEAIELSRRARRIIAQNLGISGAVMAVLALVSLTGLLPLPLAVVGHEGSTVVVVLNSLRLLRRGSA
ncbi:MAG: heavy metal translocating P-type ATPase [Candidatus Sumerlaeia bacterium]|nr:heavy metal translocating P-type ATPase [Candidatus Sumerlaeia bacterium]